MTYGRYAGTVFRKLKECLICGMEVFAQFLESGSHSTEPRLTALTSGTLLLRCAPPHPPPKLHFSIKKKTFDGLQDREFIKITFL